MGHSVESSPLGQQTVYASQYDPSLLFPIDRSGSRSALGIDGDLPFFGFDIWTGYELSWLNSKGKPVVAVAEFKIPCSSPFIIESKSFKLYLNSLNQTRCENEAEVAATLVRDLSKVAGANVGVDLMPLSDTSLKVIGDVNAICVDELDVEVDTYHPQAALLGCEGEGVVSEALISHLLKSNCPVTGQPDWASVIIEYTGKKIQHDTFLKYVISFRKHQDFHEHCVERMFMDIQKQCNPESLSVYARYTRRGGLDINPFRSTEVKAVPIIGRLIRQ